MLRPQKAYVAIANTLQAYQNVCENIHCNTTYKVGATDWASKHRETLEYMQDHFLPSGSGYDSGSTIDIDHGLKNGVLKLHTSFHHMNENGYYDGWTEHDVYVKPDLMFGFTLRITGSNRNDIKDMIAEDFDSLLNDDVWQTIGEDYNIDWHTSRYESLPTEDEISKSYDRKRQSV